MPTYKVTMFILGCGLITKEVEYITAPTEKDAEEEALWHRDGYGIYSTSIVNEEYGNLTEKQIEGVKERVSYLIGLIITDSIECGDVTHAILKEVCEDISETADWFRLDDDECCEGDIDIAVSRVMYRKVFGE